MAAVPTALLRPSAVEAMIVGEGRRRALSEQIAEQSSAWKLALCSSALEKFVRSQSSAARRVADSFRVSDAWTGQMEAMKAITATNFEVGQAVSKSFQQALTTAAASIPALELSAMTEGRAGHSWSDADRSLFAPPKVPELPSFTPSLRLASAVHTEAMLAEHAMTVRHLVSAVHSLEWPSLPRFESLLAFTADETPLASVPVLGDFKQEETDGDAWVVRTSLAVEALQDHLPGEVLEWAHAALAISVVPSPRRDQAIASLVSDFISATLTHHSSGREDELRVWASRDGSFRISNGALKPHFRARVRFALAAARGTQPGKEDSDLAEHVGKLVEAFRFLNTSKHHVHVSRGEVEAAATQALICITHLFYPGRGR